MKVEFTPSLLTGAIPAPPSKSLAHRALICAALAKGVSVIQNLQFSQDIIATMDAMRAFGAEFTVGESFVAVKGIDITRVNSAVIDCRESGSTLRFLIPVAAALGIQTAFKGKGKLPDRPITPYLQEFPQKGVSFDYKNTMPFSMTGKLQAGIYHVAGNISSQFVTGLLFALPLLNGDSEIRIDGVLESKPYADLTISMLKKYHISIEETDWGYSVKGNQRYLPCDYTVEGDYSQAAFFLVAGAIGSPVTCKNLTADSLQGDRAIVSILDSCGAQITVQNDSVTSAPGKELRPFDTDVRDIPDLVPILTVLACFCRGTSHILNAHRLRIKESDRLAAISQVINGLGGQVHAFEDRLEITGTGGLAGGSADSFNDHRIAMSAAVASVGCSSPVVLSGAQSVNKSYPNFYQDFQNLGGKPHVISME